MEKSGDVKIIPTEKERKVLEIIKGIAEGEVIVEVKGGEPVMITQVRKFAGRQLARRILPPPCGKIIVRLFD